MRAEWIGEATAVPSRCVKDVDVVHAGGIQGGDRAPAGRYLHRHHRAGEPPGEFDTSLTGLLLEACVAICKSCGDECERHAQRYEHCRLCEQACRRCEQACRELLDALK